ASVILSEVEGSMEKPAPGTPYKTENAELAVYCGQGSIIINHLKPAGKREMTGKEFLAGHPLSD
ncbi:MAG: hypothetical protein ABIS59_02915, partial [Candidatus Saccharibacteria bacterium]